MTRIFRLVVLALALVPLTVSGEAAPAPDVEPAGAQTTMTPPPFPTAAVADTGAKTPAPVGPHGQHDPHATLDPERLVKVALQHESEGRLELALKTLAEGIQKFPDSAQLYAVRGSLRLQMQQVSAALSDLENAARLDAQDAMVRVNRAQAYRSFGRYEEAMADLDFAVGQDPNLLPARFNRGALRYAGGDFEAALLDFDQCIAIDPHAPAPYFNRGSTYWELGRSEEAMADMAYFIELADNAEWKRVAEDLLNNWKIALEAEAKAARGGS